MKKLMSVIKNYKKEAILAPLFKLLEACFELFVPLVMAQIIDIGIARGDSGYVLSRGVVLFGLGAVGLISSVTAQFFAAKAATGVATELRSQMFRHIQYFQYDQIDKAGTSTLITRMTSDINQVQSGVNMTLRLFLRSPIIVFGAMIMAFTIDVKSALIFVVAIPVLAVIVCGITWSTIPMYKKVQSHLDGVMGITRENLAGARVIRAFNQEEKEQEDFFGRNEALVKMQMYVGRISAVMNPATYVVVNAAIIVLIYFGAIQIDGGILTQGEVIAILNYMSQILVELVKLANLVVTMTKAVACTERVQAVFDITAAEAAGGNAGVVTTGAVVTDDADTDAIGIAKPTNADAQQELLVFDNVSLTYAEAGAPSISRVSFRVKKGSIVGVIGGTGSGKSTLINMIPGFYKPTEGKIILEGVDINYISSGELRRRIGVVPQRTELFKGTIRSNLCWGRENATDEELWRALDRAQASEFVRGKEGQLDAEVAQRGSNFSGGQKQRLSIARALVRDPEILILDDSSSALDFATERALKDAIAELKDQMTVFIVSQRASSVMDADLIIVLDDGEAVGMGSHEELLAGCEVYQEIYYSQFERPTEKGV